MFFSLELLTSGTSISWTDRDRFRQYYLLSLGGGCGTSRWWSWMSWHTVGSWGIECRVRLLWGGWVWLISLVDYLVRYSRVCVLQFWGVAWVGLLE